MLSGVDLSLILVSTDDAGDPGGVVWCQPQSQVPGLVSQPCLHTQTHGGGGRGAGGRALRIPANHGRPRCD